MRTSKQHAGHKFTSAVADIRRMKRKNPRILSENRRLEIYVKIPLSDIPHREEGKGRLRDQFRPASPAK
jgi:adenylylsulfate kinase-like enzyme